MLTMRFATLALTMAVGAALAQSPTVPMEFPAEAKPLTADDLHQRVGGKVFRVKTAAGGAWRLQYQAGGFLYFNAGGYSDSGRWRIDGSKLCSELQKSPASCNEMRVAGDALYLKRDSGEIIKFEPN